jgi:predicted dehydrogenase
VGIGAGYFAQYHYAAWARIPEVSLVAIADPVEARATKAAADFGVPRACTDWRAMLETERPDFVDVITPPETHEEICVEAAARGIHVICQKPLAPTIQASRRLIDRMEASGVRFLVHENFRWQPWYRAIKRIQQDGAIGAFTHLAFLMRMGDGWGPSAYLLRQPYFRDYPRLLIHETGVHFIDTFRFLLGEVTSVYARLRRLNPDIAGEDVGLLCLTFENGATAVWDASRYTEAETSSPRYTFGQLRIDGMAGHLTLDTEGTLRVKALGQPGRDVAYDHRRTGFAGDCVFALQRHFVEAVSSGAPFESSGRDYLRTLEIVEAAYRSHDTGTVVFLNA